MAWRALRGASKLVASRRLDVHVEGAEFIPPIGPAIIAARHYHHLYDGCVLLATLPRPMHILVALDWASNPIDRFVMGRACRAADWPILLRTDGPTPPSAQDAAAALRVAARGTIDLLRDGRLVVVFPEAYPNIDPRYTPKPDESAFLPFHPGVVRFTAMAARLGFVVPIIPAGFSYEKGRRWRVSLRFGAPITVDREIDERVVLTDIEAQVRRLCGFPVEEPSI
jgi:1-acyl-sn-glycerol-3-phosphate acyltransferase